MKVLAIVIMMCFLGCSPVEKSQQVETHTWVLTRIKQGWRDNIGVIYWVYWKDTNNRDYSELVTEIEIKNYWVGKLWANKDRR